MTAGNHRSARSAVAVALALGIGACTAVPSRAPPAAPQDRCSPQPSFAAGGERATLWVRHSVEFRAASETIYRAAQASLGDALANPAWTAELAQSGDYLELPPAVIMDIDETVLDNSAPQAGMLLDETCLAEFDDLWDEWVASRSAPAVPGAVAFIRAARAMRDPAGQPVRVFFITNRECRLRDGDDSPCPQETDTLANLRALGLDVPGLADDLLLKGERPEWASEKLSRRLEVTKTHRIVLNLGDDFGDFLPGVRRQSAGERERARCAHRERWGREWFVIPNPMYGSWLVALGPDLGHALGVRPPGPDCDED